MYESKAVRVLEGLIQLKIIKSASKQNTNYLEKMCTFLLTFCMYFESLTLTYKNYFV